MNVLYWRIGMVSITLSVPESLKHEMDLFQEINWSAVARDAIQRKIALLEKFREFTKDSDFTEAEALELGRKVGAGVRKRHK